MFSFKRKACQRLFRREHFKEQLTEAQGRVASSPPASCSATCVLVQVLSRAWCSSSFLTPVSRVLCPGRIRCTHSSSRLLMFLPSPRGRRLSKLPARFCLRSNFCSDPSSCLGEPQLRRVIGQSRCAKGKLK